MSDLTRFTQPDFKRRLWITFDYVAIAVVIVVVIAAIAGAIMLPVSVIMWLFG